MIGSPLFGSISSPTLVPLLAFPRKPCSGPNSLTRCTPRAGSTSTLGLSPMIEDGLPTRPTRFPLRYGTYLSVWSAPVMSWPDSAARSRPTRRIARRETRISVARIGFMAGSGHGKCSLHEMPPLVLIHSRRVCLHLHPRRIAQLPVLQLKRPVMPGTHRAAVIDKSTRQIPTRVRTVVVHHIDFPIAQKDRSEERRVGKECRARWW